jgi:hypothetical protein
VRNCPTRKKGRQYASTVDVDSEPHQIDEDIKDEAFFFISPLSQEDLLSPTFRDN